MALGQLLKGAHLFVDVPEDWYVLVTDIVGSSQAVNEGRHVDVNLIATGSIISVLNALKKSNPDLRVPYFFGGDGATFMVPKSVINAVEVVLIDYSLHILKTFNLVLRVGKLEVKSVYENGYSLRLAKLRHNKYLTTPVVLGNGLKFAESKIKSDYIENVTEINNAKNINLEGMECRWDEIMPPKTDNKVICLLISSTSEDKQGDIFSEIVSEIDATFGLLEERTPITKLKLRLKPTIKKIRNEMYARLGRFKRSYLAINWMLTKIGVLYFDYFKEGKLYLERIAKLSDTIMLDGSISTVITGNENQIRKIQAYLDGLESQGKIIFGIHNTYASIMSCYVQDREDKHIHFVDGTEGGYTSASLDYKRKLKAQYSK